MYRHLDRPLDLTTLEKEFHLSRSYINAVFKKYAGRSPIDFFLNIKMQEACKLLRSTKRTVQEIGAELGYEDPFYFSRAFRKVMGCPPGNIGTGSER